MKPGYTHFPSDCRTISRIARANIEPEAVISILPLPRITPPIGDYQAKLRIIYRTSGGA